MRAIKTTTISILALGLLAGSAVGVAAQDDASADPTAPAFFEVEYIAGDDFEMVEGTYEELGPGLERYEGEVVRGMLVDAEDPRASGEWSMADNVGVVFFEPPADRSVADVRARSIRLENEAGAWEGTGWAATNAPASGGPEAGTVARMSILEGTGAYEGLTLVIADTDGGAQGWGWIMPDGLVPAIPEPPAE